MIRFRYFVLLCLFFIFNLVSNVYATEVITISSKNKEKIPLLLLAQSESEFANPELVNNIERQVKSFLSEGKIFEFKNVYLRKKGSDIKEEYRNYCVKIGCFSVVELRFKNNNMRRGYATVEYSIFDVLLKKKVIDGRLHFKIKNWYKVASNISDLVYKAITNSPGYFSSYLIYVSEFLQF